MGRANLIAEVSAGPECRRVLVLVHLNSGGQGSEGGHGRGCDGMRRVRGVVICPYIWFCVAV